MKKLFLLFLFCFALVLAGCGDKNSKLNPDNPVTLTMWHVYGSQTKSPLNDAIARFNETEGKQKGVIVKVACARSVAMPPTAGRPARSSAMWAPPPASFICGIM